MSEIRRICVYCGSRTGVRPAYAEAARHLGALLAAEGIGLVTGGGQVGLMGEIADAVLAGGGEAVGVIPQALFDLGVDAPDAVLEGPRDFRRPRVAVEAVLLAEVAQELRLDQ